jgi:hypothetical protein
MKALATLGLIAVSFMASDFALACSPAEAQFIGEVTSVQKSGGKCLIQVGNFSFYNESGVCPLDQVEATEASIAVESCNVKVGAPASGYLSRGDSGVVTLD